MLNAFWWRFPLSLYSFDADTWGLYTLVYFVQSISIASPLLDKRFRAAIQQLPELVMAGACLPDLAVISKKFKTTHQWQKATYLIEKAHFAEETAIAVGYASHLYVDVVAHNHIVPTREALWEHESVFTHIGAEWAMDVHVARSLHKTPGELLSQHANLMSHFIAPCFQQPQQLVRNKLCTLSYSDRVIRGIKLPSLIHKYIHFTNNKKHKHFDYYINKTETAMKDFHKILNCHLPN